MHWTDIGANLTHESFTNDLTETLQRANEAQVKTIIVTGSDLQHSQQALELCDQFPQQLYCTAGIHPHAANSVTNEDWEHLIQLLQTPKDFICAVGETGLDFNRMYSAAAIQEKVFIQQLELAAITKKPVFLHQRDAHERFFAILKQYRDRLSNAVVHCFTDSKTALYDYLNLDCYIGLTGWICDERRGQHLLPLIADIPRDRLLLETDAPYLLPRDIRPKPKSRRNEPYHLPHIGQQVAKCYQCSPAEIAALTTQNAYRCFNLSTKSC